MKWFNSLRNCCQQYYYIIIDKVKFLQHIIHLTRRHGKHMDNSWEMPCPRRRHISYGAMEKECLILWKLRQHWRIHFPNIPCLGEKILELRNLITIFYALWLGVITYRTPFLNGPLLVDSTGQWANATYS